MHSPWSKNTVDLQACAQAQRNAWSDFCWQILKRTWQGSFVHQVQGGLAQGLLEETQHPQSPQETLNILRLKKIFFSTSTGHIQQTFWNSSFISCQVGVVIGIKGNSCAVNNCLCYDMFNGWVFQNTHRFMIFYPPATAVDYWRGGTFGSTSVC